MRTANLTSAERRHFRNWSHRLVDWKWQYMSQMWSRFSPYSDVLMTKVGVSEMKMPVSEKDGRVTSMDPSALAGIEAAIANKDLFMALTEMFHALDSAVNQQHQWLI